MAAARNEEKKTAVARLPESQKPKHFDKNESKGEKIPTRFLCGVLLMLLLLLCHCFAHQCFACFVKTGCFHRRGLPKYDVWVGKRLQMKRREKASN